MTEVVSVEIIKNDLLKNIAKKYNISYEALEEELNNLTNTRTVNSKYYCDHRFFSRDTEESFYWAGFIAADGCVYKKNKNRRLIISLAEKDQKHLECFKRQIQFDGPISKSITKHSHKNSNWKDSVKLTVSVSSSQFFEDLKRFNIIPAKTHVYTFPEWLIDHKYVNHFMRGYSDGDGSFFHDKTRPRVCFELRGTKEFLTIYKEILENNFAIKSQVKVTTPDSTSKIKYYGKKIVPQITNFLYKEATTMLDRKYLIAKKSIELLGEYNENPI